MSAGSEMCLALFEKGGFEISEYGRFIRRTAYLAILVLSLSVFFVPISSAEEGDISRAYDSLTESQQKAYNALDHAVENSCTSASINYLTLEEAEVVRDAYDCDHPEVFWFDDCFTVMYYTDTGMASEFGYTATISSSEIATKTQAIAEKLKSLEVDTSASEYKQVKKIHDWLVTNITYTSDAPDRGNIYGAIVDGKCVCEGYAKAFSYICHLYGFECLYLYGYTYSSSTVSHAWNIVHAEGDWYFVDVTWDDDERYSAEHDYFMVGYDTTIRHRTFGTEDHMATTLWGIVPAEEKYQDPESRTFGLLIYGVLALLVILYIARRIRRHMKVKRSMCQTYEPVNTAYVLRCPSCGEPIQDGSNFCYKCGRGFDKDP